MVYEKRLLLYADILGWKAAIRNSEQPRLLEAVNHIHRRAEEMNEREREKLRAQDGRLVDTEIGRVRMQVLPTAFQSQFGAFSDHFVHSVPASWGDHILSVGHQLTIDLLRLGFLVRGAVVVGDHHHKDNLVFGPALLEAVEIEENVALYPRIVVTDAAAEICLRLHDERHKTLLTDQTGTLVVNPFALPFEGPDHLVEQFADQNFHLPQLRKLIRKNIEDLTAAELLPQAAKWQYLESFIEGPVFEAIPQLAFIWKK